MFEVAEAYEQRMGRWSRQLAPLFVDFVGVRDGEKVLDAGCGTGSLSATLAKVTGASKIVGIDPSKGFIEYARMQVADPRVIFEKSPTPKICVTQTILSTYAWLCSRLITFRMPRRPRKKCAALPKHWVSSQPPCGTVATIMSFTAAFGMPPKRPIRQRNGPLKGENRTVLPKHFHSSGIALV